MEKKPPEKSFQTKILEMAVKSDQVDMKENQRWKILLGSKKSILHIISIIPPPRVPEINGHKGKTGNFHFQGACNRYSLHYEVKIWSKLSH